VKAPDQDSINHWITIAKEDIQESQLLFKNGFYKENNLPHQHLYSGLSGDYGNLGRALFLNHSPIEEVRKSFSEATEHMLKNFKMVYDKTDPDYVGDKWPPKNPHYTGHKNSPVEAKWLSPVYGQVCWADVSETYFIEGMNYSFMAANFELGRELGLIYQDSPDGYKMDIDVNRYAHALASFLKGKRMDAWGLLQDQLKVYENNPPKSIGDKNYFSLITALFGIIDKNENQFNEGLALQLKLYESEAKGELKDTDEEFICDDAVALANLGLHHGLEVTVEHNTLPKGLLIELE